jgi:hypothetical protein
MVFTQLVSNLRFGGKAPFGSIGDAPTAKFVTYAKLTSLTFLSFFFLSHFVAYSFSFFCIRSEDFLVYCDDCDRGCSLFFSFTHFCVALLTSLPFLFFLSYSVFHTFCTKPRLREVPDHRWVCSDCIHCIKCKRRTAGNSSKARFQYGFVGSLFLSLSCCSCSQFVWTHSSHSYSGLDAHCVNAVQRLRTNRISVCKCISLFPILSSLGPFFFIFAISLSLVVVCARSPISKMILDRGFNAMAALTGFTRPVLAWTRLWFKESMTKTAPFCAVLVHLNSTRRLSRRERKSVYYCDNERTNKLKVERKRKKVLLRASTWSG